MPFPLKREHPYRYEYNDTSLFSRRCPGIYLSQSYTRSDMCTKFG
jgi:hypothetical protein